MQNCGAQFLIPESAVEIDRESMPSDRTPAPGKEIREEIIDTNRISLKKPYPGILQAIWLLIFLLLVYVIVRIPVGALTQILYLKHYDTMAIATSISIAIILLYGFRKASASFSEIYPFRPFRIYLLFPVFLTIIGISIIESEIDNLFRTILPMPQEIAELFIDIALARIGLWRTIIFAVILAPLTEEMLFRGLILQGFLNRYNTKKAVVVSAILFGLFHQNPWQFFGAIVGGVILAWWFVNTRSLLLCLFGHALANSLPLIFTNILCIEIRGYSAISTLTPQLQPLWFDISGLLLTGIGIWLSIRMFKKTKHVV